MTANNLTWLTILLLSPETWPHAFVGKILTHTQIRVSRNAHTSVKVQFSHLQSVGLTLFLTEAENNHWLEVPLHDHLHYLEHAWWAWLKYKDMQSYMNYWIKDFYIKIQQTHTPLVPPFLPFGSHLAPPLLPPESPASLSTCIAVLKLSSLNSPWRKIQTQKNVLNYTLPYSSCF